ncbi:tRNA threonylcarbamoyladenosine dehydratase [soil metagenome]
MDTFEKALASTLGPEPAPDFARRFAGVAQLYGDAALERLERARIVVVGLGGVGSWTAEALARTAVGSIRLVDLDHISESNTNRQLHAFEGQYGRAKVEAMAERLLAINPRCRVETVDDFLEAGTTERCLADADFVIDAVDSVTAKLLMVVEARRRNLPLLVCGGTGGRLDAFCLRRSDLADVRHDALLAKVRSRLRREHGLPAGSTKGKAPRLGVDCLWIDQPVAAPSVSSCEIADGLLPSAGLQCGGYGSAVHVTAAVGLAAAGIAVDSVVSDRNRLA